MPDGVDELVSPRRRPQAVRGRRQPVERRPGARGRDRPLDGLDPGGRRDAPRGRLDPGLGDRGDGAASTASCCAAWAARASRRSCWARRSAAALHVLDTTDPDAVLAVPVDGSLFVIASKSGSTLEPEVMEEYFCDAAGRRRLALRRHHRPRLEAGGAGRGARLPAHVPEPPRHRRAVLGAVATSASCRRRWPASTIARCSTAAAGVLDASGPAVPAGRQRRAAARRAARRQRRGRAATS